MDGLKTKTTVPYPPVGADGGQPLSKIPKESIAEDFDEHNPPEQDLAEIMRQLGRVSDPAYLPLVFRQIFLQGLVFRLSFCYTLGGYFEKRLSPVWANRRIWGSRFLF